MLTGVFYMIFECGSGICVNADLQDVSQVVLSPSESFMMIPHWDYFEKEC